MDEDVIGTGAYVFNTYEAGSVWKVDRNVDYFQEGRPFLDAIDILIISDRATRLGALKTGQLDLTVTASAGINVTEKEDLEKNHADTVTALPYISLLGKMTRMNPGSSGPFGKLEVRRAVYLTANRQAAITVLNSGGGRLGLWLMNPGPWSRPVSEIERMPGVRADKNGGHRRGQASVGPGRLRQRFRSDHSWVRSTVQSWIQHAEMLQAQLLEIGIKTKLNLQETARWAELSNAGEWEIQPATHYQALDDPYAALSTPFAPGWNVDDSGAKELLSEIKGTLDVAKKKELAQRLEKHYLDQAYGVPLLFDNAWMGVASRVGGFTAPIGLAAHLTYVDVHIKG